MVQPVAQTRHAVQRSGFANPLTLGVTVTNPSFVKVYADDLVLTLGVDYSIDGIGDPNGIEITINDLGDYPLTVETFAAVFMPLYEQGADLSAGGRFGVAFEAALDAINRQIQSLDDRLRRSLTLPPTYENEAQISFPLPEPGRVLVGNDQGTGYDAGPTVPEINTIVGITAQINAVSAIAPSVVTVANNAANVQTAANNISAIIAAPAEAQAAANSAVMSFDWANKAEDVPVLTSPARFSAFHWSRKALASATAAAASAALAASNIVGAIAGYATKATPAAADLFGFVQASDTTGRKLTWTQLIGALAAAAFVRYDAAQTLTAANKTQALTNLGANPILGAGDARLLSAVAGSILWTGIAADTQEIIISFADLFSTGGDTIFFRVGTSAGSTTAGYLGANSRFGSNTMASQAYSNTNARLWDESTRPFSGQIILTRVRGNLWQIQMQGASNDTSPLTVISSGYVDLGSDVLDRVAIISSSNVGVGSKATLRASK